MRNIPWYDRFRECLVEASCYLLEYESGEWLLEATYLNFEIETLAHFIFESNNLEHEGLPFGETRELLITGFRAAGEDEIDTGLSNHEKEVSKVLKQLPLHWRMINPQPPVDEEALKREIEEMQYSVVAKYDGKNKDAKTVVQYTAACIYAKRHSLSVAESRYMADLIGASKIANALGAVMPDGATPEEAELIGKLKALSAIENIPEIKETLSENLIKRLHEVMAQGLIDPKYAPAGEYRNHPIMTGMEDPYPAHEDVSNAMKCFARNFGGENREVHPIVLAAEASTQFVLIHPFSDFNGRMSRLIINIVLHCHRAPFWVCLRSNKKSRHRYITALRHYRRDKFKSMVTLISLQVIENFKEFNRVMTLSGYKPIIISNEIRKKVEALSDEELISLQWPRHPHLHREMKLPLTEQMDWAEMLSWMRRTLRIG